MPDYVSFGGPGYFAMLGLLAFARGMDFLSTWIATPNLVLEGNPLAKKLGWKKSIVLNIVMCVGFAFSPLPAVVISTTSVLVASRNFQQAWLMRALGEEFYRSWHIARLFESSRPLYLFCLFAQTGLIAIVGGALIWFSREFAVTAAIGWGVVAYAAAVAFYTLLSLWRMGRLAGQN